MMLLTEVCFEHRVHILPQTLGSDALNWIGNVFAANYRSIRCQHVHIASSKTIREAYHSTRHAGKPGACQLGPDRQRL